MFFVRRERWTLTWTSRLLLLLVVAALILLAVRNIYGFLAVNSPVGGKTLVVEAWIPRHALREAVDIFNRGGYDRIIAAGTINIGEDPGKEFFASGRLIELGVPADRVVDATYAGPERDRTFHAAMTVKTWLQGQQIAGGGVDVVTMGVHARRSRLLYERALGDEFRVGVIALAERGFDAGRWWRSSQGTRRVIDETIAYVYARVFFLP